MADVQEIGSVEREQKESPSALLAIGSVLGAIAASSCCIVPLALFSVGVTGAWIGNLAALTPYQPVIVFITLSFLGAGYWMVYRTPKVSCAEGSQCARPATRRLVKIALRSATVLIVTATLFPYVAPRLLGI